MPEACLAAKATHRSSSPQPDTPGEVPLDPPTGVRMWLTRLYVTIAVAERQRSRAAIAQRAGAPGGHITCIDPAGVTSQCYGVRINLVREYVNG